MSDDLPLRHRAVWAVLVLVIVGLIGMALWERAKDSSPPLPVFGQIDDFSLTNQAGNPMHASDLKGHIWIADFIFTRCPGMCIVVTSTLSAVNKELKDMTDLRLVSFSMDPEYDTPEILSAYAQKQGASLPRWSFLTGPKDVMHALTRDQFKQAVMEKTGGDQPIIHSDRLVLVDQKGRIRGFYSGEKPESVKDLAAAVKKLSGARQEHE